MRGLSKVPFAYKLSLTISGMVLSILFVASGHIVSRQQQLIEQQFTDGASTTIQQLASNAVELVFTEDQLALNSLVSSTTGLEQILGTAILNREGITIASAGITPNDGFLPLDDPFLPNGYEYRWPNLTDSNALVSYVYPVTFKSIVGGYALITMSRAQLERTKNDVYWSQVSTAIVLAALITLVTVLISRKFAKPIDALVEATKAIQEGKYGYRIRSRHRGEFHQVVDSFNKMAEGIEQKIRVESAFNRFVSSRVAEKYIRDADSIELGGQIVNASVLFVDIVGYTALSESMPPQQMAKLLNELFEFFSFAANQTGGMVDKYIGDCAMLVFGAPEKNKNHHLSAVYCALLIRSMMQQFNRRREKQGLDAVEVRVGISSGEMLAGILGSSDRVQYTVIGDPVNLSSRLCALAPVGGIIVDTQFFQYANIDDDIEYRPYRSVLVKGKKLPVETIEIISIKGHWQRSIDLTCKKLIS
ncbi:adenylate/guanylate cyclase domain-containing protein [Gynuella sunshinyii]|nr:adenylate/guanylate cyclase domain-containing protein [Gynuella sunshinyii]